MKIKLLFAMTLVSAGIASMVHAESPKPDVYVYNGCHETLHVKSFPIDKSYKGVDEDIHESATLHVPLTNPYTALIKVTNKKGDELFNSGIWKGRGIDMIEKDGACRVK